MSTRKSKDNSVLHQNRFASSPEFERGVIATGAAKRCAILDDKKDRELVWFVHHLSHKDGGLAAVAVDLLKMYPHRLGTPSMVTFENRKSQKFNVDEVREIRMEMPRELRRQFPLRGETKSELYQISEDRFERLQRQADNSRRLCQMAEFALHRFAMIDAGRQVELDAMDAQEREEAKKNPAAYPVAEFRDLCRQAAEHGDSQENQFLTLEKELFRLCLDPACDLKKSGPWYFADLFNVLREYHQQWIQKKSNVVVTTLGKKVYETLDYTLHSHSLTLLEGNARMGKSFSARAWCEQHPGKARFVEVPGGNDDAAFFRALARGIGLGNFLSYKVAEIRDRVESVLRTGDIILVLDEAQRLWPQRIRYSFPSRIIWVMTLANAGVPICMVSTPQFILAQKAIEKSGWNSDQLTGRNGYYEFLPTELETSDLMAVSRSVLPEANDEVLKALSIYAKTSARYLAAVDTIAKRAKYIAERAGRENCSTQDIRTAMKESVIPSDTMLAHALDQAKNKTTRTRLLPSPKPVALVQTKIPPNRANNPPTEFEPAISRLAGGIAELVKG
ncbi:MAG TPA: ATP-binding protein [Verrucomicrobiae bacterium]|jgi:hypothetical protein|nr:ATP-binding protein [Verrucomicrobiae bacterium]